MVQEILPTLLRSCLCSGLQGHFGRQFLEKRRLVNKEMHKEKENMTWPSATLDAAVVTLDPPSSFCTRCMESPRTPSTLCKSIVRNSRCLDPVRSHLHYTCLAVTCSLQLNGESLSIDQGMANPTINLERLTCLGPPPTLSMAIMVDANLARVSPQLGCIAALLALTPWMCF